MKKKHSIERKQPSVGEFKQTCRMFLNILNTKKRVLLLGFLYFCLFDSINASISDDLIPVITVNTMNHEMPTCTIVKAPEGCIGVSITNNHYLQGKMTMTLKGHTLYDSGDFEKNVSGIRIKIRGNSTGAYMAQHPYKIKLSKKFDLLRREDKDFEHKEWLLLPMYTWNIKMTHQESNILNIIGLTISKILEKEWTPDYDFVHVILNGKYQGMYYLMESVEKGKKRVNISNEGCLIEHDTFWWNEDVYFKTEHQSHDTGYTFNYPDDNDVNDSIQSAISDYMNQVENSIYSQENLSDIIDLLSFAKWLLIHDILGTDDAAGCNRFLYRYDMNTSLLQMGPVWDFDSTFRSDKWSALHDYKPFFYPQLLQRKDFISIYSELWKREKPLLYQRIREELERIWDKYGDIFDESMKIHQTKYPNEGHQSFKSQIEEVEEKIYKRIEIVDSLMSTEIYTNHINTVVNGNTTNTHITDLLGRKFQHSTVQKLPKGIYILHNHKGLNQKIIIR